MTTTARLDKLEALVAALTERIETAGEEATNLRMRVDVLADIAAAAAAIPVARPLYVPRDADSYNIGPDPASLAPSEKNNAKLPNTYQLKLKDNSRNGVETI